MFPFVDFAIHIAYQPQKQFKRRPESAAKSPLSWTFLIPTVAMNLTFLLIGKNYIYIPKI